MKSRVVSEKDQRIVNRKDPPRLASRIADYVNRRIYLFLILPSLIFFIFFKVIPFLMTIGLSLSRWNGVSISTIKFIAFGNYVKLFKDWIFWLSLRNNILFVILMVSVQITLSLLCAIAIESKVKFSGLFRNSFFFPVILSTVVVGLLFGQLLSVTAGVLNPFLEKIHLASLTRDWLGDPQVAIYVVIFVSIWKMFGFTMLLFIAGLRSIPSVVYEAAEIDGAKPWHRFWYITLPLLREVSVVVVILTVNAAFRTFDMVYVMTGGGPYHASDVLAHYTYHLAFGSSRMGYGSTVATVLFVIVFCLVFVQLRLARAGTLQG